MCPFTSLCCSSWCGRPASMQRCPSPRGGQRGGERGGEGAATGACMFQGERQAHGGAQGRAGQLEGLAAAAGRPGTPTHAPPPLMMPLWHTGSRRSTTCSHHTPPALLCSDTTSPVAGMTTDTPLAIRSNQAIDAMRAIFRCVCGVWWCPPKTSHLIS